MNDKDIQILLLKQQVALLQEKVNFRDIQIALLEKQAICSNVEIQMLKSKIKKTKECKR